MKRVKQLSASKAIQCKLKQFGAIRIKVHPMSLISCFHDLDHVGDLAQCSFFPYFSHNPQPTTLQLFNVFANLYDNKDE